MSNDLKTSGRCLCGEISFTAELTNNHADACHCGMCQHWGGGPLISVGTAAGDLHIVGGEKLTVFESSEWAERAFCSKCGSHMFFRLKPTGQFMVPVGLLDSQSGLGFTKEIFFDERSALYQFANPTTKQTGAEVRAEFAAALSKKRQQRSHRAEPGS